ncbi:MAG: hypothetical protein JXM74_02580 [Fusobacteriaceae bacterium]|nr:hypothetical protein [Fusobacteriaceae bacterium]
MRKNESKFITKCVSEAGSFNKNRDFNGFVMLDNYGCWITVDGLDTCEEKHSAELVASSIVEDFTIKPSMSTYAIKKYIKNAHEVLKEFNAKYPLNASISLLVTNYSEIKYSSIGNTRFYHFRKNKLIKKSKDESIANLLHELGEIDSDSLITHTHKNTLYNYLGKEGTLKVNVSSKIPLLNDDVLLMGTIGMWENINEKEFSDILKASMDCEEFIENLEYIVRKKGGKCLNNYTITSIFTQEVFNKKRYKKKQELENPKKKWNWEFLKNKYVKRILTGILILIVAATALVIKSNIDKKKQQILEKKESDKAKQQILEEGNVDMNIGNYEISLKKFEEARIKYKNDPEKLKDIDQKISLIKQAIIGRDSEKLGDENVANKNYDVAQTDYTKALAIYTTTKMGDIQKLNDKIKKNTEVVDILKNEKLGDDQSKNQNFSKAKEIYQSIIDKLGPDKNPEITARLKEKLANIDKVDEADTILASGNTLYRKGQYDLAKNKYESALGIYKEAGQIDKVTEVKGRIADIESIKVSNDEKKMANEAKKLEGLGDDNISEKQYSKSKENYRAAYEKYSNVDKEIDANRVLKKIDSISLFEKFDVVKNFEIEGDNFYSEKEYKKAIKSYEKAKEGYKELNRTNEVSICEDKIAKAKKKDKILGIF